MKKDPGPHQDQAEDLGTVFRADIHEETLQRMTKKRQILGIKELPFQRRLSTGEKFWKNTDRKNQAM